MSEVRRLVLDVLKPQQPTMLVLADKLGDLEGVNGVDITLIEIDNKVENIKITLEGDDIDFQDVAEVVQESGGSIHSIDKCSTGKRLIDEVETPQDAGAQRSQLAPASCGVSTSSMRRLPVEHLSMEWMLPPDSWTTSATSWKSMSSPSRVILMFSTLLSISMSVMSTPLTPSRSPSLSASTSIVGCWGLSTSSTRRRTSLMW